MNVDQEPGVYQHSRLLEAAVSYNNRLKMWLMGGIFFLVCVQLAIVFTAPEMSEISEKIILMIVLALIGHLWMREVGERERVQAMNDELLSAYVRLENAEVETIASLINLVERRALYLHGHSARVARLAVLIGNEMGLSADTVESIRRAALLHDLGKLVIDDEILKKSGALSPEEREKINRHTILGDEILRPLKFLHLERAAIRHHHERWDGTGYPDGKRGADIPLESRIIAVCEAFDEMNTTTFYRAALSKETILDELTRGAGTQFDETVVQFLLRLIKKDGGLWGR